MIQDLPLPKYYLENVDIDVAPQIGETIIGVMGTNVAFENPRMGENPGGFRCDGKLSLHLYRSGETPWEVDDEDEIDKFGSVETEFTIHIPSESAIVKEHTEEWIETKEYSAVDSAFRTHLESGILQYIIDPIGKLLETSYSGIVPRISFSHSSTEESELEEE